MKDRIKVQIREGHWMSMPLADESQKSIDAALKHLGAEQYTPYEVYDGAKGPSDSPWDPPKKELHRPLNTTKPGWSA